ncbi:DUF362 domain-containing protein [Myxococcota bacterium]
MTKAKVAIVRTSPATVLDDTVRLFELGGGKEALDRSQTTIIKDNISWHYPFPSANTTPWQLEGTILALKQHGFEHVTCVQNKTEVTKAEMGEELNHFTPVLRDHKIEVLFNFREDHMRWTHFKPKARMHALNDVYGEGIHIPDYFVGKNMVHLPTVKCHIYTTTTGAMKNAFGGLLTHKRHRTHTYIHETLVDLLAIQKEIHSGLFCIMDGTTAGNGSGPRVMKPVEKNVMLASSDQVAVDAVAAKIMGFDPMSIRYIRMAHQDGLGVGEPGQIEIVGDADIAKENWGFKVGFSFHKFAGWVTWFGPTRFLQRALTEPPILHLGNYYSHFYHDVLHWPLIESKIYQRWLKDSEWGRLFARYAYGALRASIC